MQVVRVRLRFVIITVVCGIIVGQWPTLRAVWDRWNWGRSHQHAQGTVSSDQEYFCPMDPGIVNAWPMICPICNMDLVPRKRMDAQMLPEGVVARMQFSPYRIQLAGIKTTLIAARPLSVELNYSGVLKNIEGKLGFETAVSIVDTELFREKRVANVSFRNNDKPVAATVSLIDSTRLPQVRILIDDPADLTAGLFVTASVSVPAAESEEAVAVPESAVIDRGKERLVFVETMPGMFDAIPVELGRRCGAF
jgi:hypothetical protein